MLSALQLAHRAYLKSATWKDIRRQVLERDENKCVKCKNPGFEVHHKHYKNWGNENLEDLVTLCSSCRSQLHTLKSATRNSKAIGAVAIYNYLTKKQKEDLMKEFSLGENGLYLKIRQDEDELVVNKATYLLGYKHWYSQKSNSRQSKRNNPIKSFPLENKEKISFKDNFKKINFKGHTELIKDSDIRVFRTY